jgi:hypothetical protein
MAFLLFKERFAAKKTVFRGGIFDILLFLKKKEAKVSKCHRPEYVS